MDWESNKFLYEVGRIEWMDWESKSNEYLRYFILKTALV